MITAFCWICLRAGRNPRKKVRQANSAVFDHLVHGVLCVQLQYSQSITVIKVVGVLGVLGVLEVLGVLGVLGVLEYLKHLENL